MTTTRTIRAAPVPPGALSEEQARAAGEEQAAALNAHVSDSGWQVEVIENPLRGTGYVWRIINDYRVVVVPAPKENGRSAGFNAWYQFSPQVTVQADTPYLAIAGLLSVWEARSNEARRAVDRLRMTMGKG